MEKSNENIDKQDLLSALKNDDLKGVIRALDSGVNIETKFSEMTPLIIASANGNIEIIQLFLDNGADIEAKNDDGLTALIVASNLGKKKAVQLLLDNGADIEAKDDDGFTALNWSIYSKNQEIAQFLLDNGADIEAKDNINGKTALIKASSRGNIEMVQLLLDNGADIEANAKNSINSLLRQMVFFRNKPLKFIINSILDLFEGINGLFIISKLKKNNENTALTKASKNGHKDVVKLLVKNGADVEYIMYKKEVSVHPRVEEIGDSIMGFIFRLIFRGTPLHASFNTKEVRKEIQLKKEKELQSDFIGHCKYLKNGKETMSNPQKLVNILTNFTIDTPIKYTTHLWDFGDRKKEYGSFQGFIEAISKQWKSIEKELKKLSPNLHTKIYNFLLNEFNEHSWCSRADISIGWSSLEGLEAWCNEGNNPFDFRLKESYEVDNKTITTFVEIINLFKREIEIRNENNMLESIFLEHQKKIGRKFSVDLIKLKGRTFYTDVDKFQESIGRIFEEIKKRDAYEIRIEVFEQNAEFIELKITQLNSFANRSAKEMLQEVDDGDFKILKENLTNLCDWSIESRDENESYRVNYLRMPKTPEIEKLSDSIDGFTYILRFYK